MATQSIPMLTVIDKGPAPRPTFQELLRIETATLQAQFPDHAEAIGRAYAILTDGRLFPEDEGTSAMVLGSDGQAWYHTNGTCTCAAAGHHPDRACKHRMALRLYQRVSAQLVPPPEPDCILATSSLDPEIPIAQDAADAAPPEIPAKWIQMIHGKPFVKYAGLLALAHERGLQSLSAKLTTATPDFAIAEAQACFLDGRVFWEAADATPDNVHVAIRPHFHRMALTRAKARVLRDALNIGICAVEEVE